MKRTNRITATKAIFAAMVLIAAAPGFSQDEGGGTSGADFLLSPPASRTDAMGGALDAFGDNLEMVLLNPALLTSVDNFKLQVNISPLPNNVTNAALSVGLPIAGGVGGAAVQLFNVGQYTYIDAFGQPSSTESVYDAAVALGYAYPVWRSLSAGINLKAVYRVLGAETAFAFGGDLGGAVLFEIPYIGQPPKAPTYEELHNEFLKNEAALVATKEKELKVAMALSLEISDSIESTQGKIAGIEEKTSAEQAKEEPNAEKIQGYKTQLDETNATLDGLNADLSAAQTAEADAIREIENSFFADLADAQAVFDKKVADLNDIANERSRLFSVISDPNTELEAGLIDANIDDSISKTNEFLSGRIKAFKEAEQLFRGKRESRSQELQTEIDSYAEQIDDELGPANARLNSTIEDLTLKIADLEASLTDENKSEVNAKVKERKQQLNAAEKELSALQSDPWIRRLARRIDDKLAEKEQIAAEIVQNQEKTEKDIADAEAQALRDTQRFENLRGNLKKELKRAKLKRELDLVDASSEPAAATAVDRYLETETRLYQQLLAAMYSNEEKIFQSRLTAIRLDSEDRKFDYETEYEKSLELLEEDLAFQERFLNKKIGDLEQAAKESGSETEDPELTSAKAELQEKQEGYQIALEKLNTERNEYLGADSLRIALESATVRTERERIRLIFLQTDEPYKNSSFTLAVRNIGTNVKFNTEGYPMPAMISAGVSYTALKVDNHIFRLSVQADLPLLFSPGVPFYQDIAVGVGGEYSFFDLAYIRAGYTFNSNDRNFAAGFGMKLGLGFTEYAVDYTFRPLPDYGFVHSFGIAISF